MLPVHKEKLHNDLTVLVAPMPDSHVVALQAWVGVGSADEKPEEAGLAHVHEHMLFKGTARRRVGEIAQAVEAAGGDINAWTSLDQTVYHVVMASRFLGAGLDVLADAIQHSTFDPRELEREKEVVLEEIKRGEDHPGRIVMQDVFELAYQVHPYRNPVIGSPTTVAGFSRREVLAFYRRWYVPGNIVLVIVGDVRVSSVMERVRKAFGDFGARRPPSRHGLREPPQRAPRARVRSAPFEECYFNFSAHAPPVDHPDVAALDLLTAILGQGESSRLNQEVKRRRGLVNDVYAYAYTPKEPGIVTVGASGAPERVREALRACLEESLRLREEPVSDDELAKARTLLESQTVYDKETAQGMARKLGFYESALGDIGFEQRYYEAMARVTPQDLLAVARRYLAPERFSLAVVYPQQASQRPTKKECLALLRQARRPRHRGQPQPEPRAAVVRAELPNGVRLLVRRDGRVPLVAVRAVWNGGLRLERPQVNGITNFVAEILTQGTERRSAAQVAHAADSMAGSIAGFAGRNSFGMRADFLARYFEGGLELLAECLTMPSFDGEEVRRQRELILEEIRVLDDNPSGVAFRLLTKTLFPRHPYRMHSLGTRASIGRLDPGRLRRYYRGHYPVDRMVLSIVGDVDPALVVERVAQILPRPARPARPAKAPPPDPPLPGPLLVEKSLEKQQAHLVLGFRGTTVQAPDRYALEVLSTILSGQGGRLFYELRDRQSLAYSVSSFSVEGVEPGYFAIYMGTSPEKIPRAITGMLSEVDKVRAQLVTVAELRRAQRYLVGSHAIAMQRLAARAAMMAFDECYGLGYDHSEHYEKHVLAVTREDVLACAQRYLDLDRYALAVARPPTCAGLAAKALAARG